ncbi:MAG: S4 domain-containing protein [Patescibacteria group bacterium]|nr:S4 domain-containing protein [Patescibacteria group bacterium]
MRINKFLAHAGIASRRNCDILIQDGEVTINGEVAKSGDQVSDQDVVMFE